MKKVTFSVIVFFAIHLTANFNLFAQVLGPIIGYGGLCESSAAVSLVDNTFIVANDEDNLLRIFDASVREPVKTLKISDIFKPEIKDTPKMDLEGATWIDNRIFWIGSHSVKSDAGAAPARHRLFATEVVLSSNGEFNLVRSGQIYTTLIADLEKDARFADFNLQKAKAIRPKEIGGLSIEGLAATPEGNILIGFRNPLIGGEIAPDTSLIKGKAPVVRLLNPTEVIDGKQAKFGDPIVLDLDGLGIRSLEFDMNRRKYLIVTGPYFSNDALPGTAKALETKIYLWSGVSSEKPELLKSLNLLGLNIEAAFFYPHSKSASAQLVSDDGENGCVNNFRSVQLDF